MKVQYPFIIHACPEIPAYPKAISINPNCPVAYYNKAQAFLQKKS